MKKLMLIMVMVGALFLPSPVAAGTSPTPETTVTDTGDYISSVKGPDGIQTDPGWWWTRTWTAKDIFGVTKYSFAQRTEWHYSTGTLYPKITSVYTQCWRVGGYFQYIGCSQSHSPVGNDFVNVVVQWTFRTGGGPIYFYSYPHTNTNFWWYGAVSGTVYYQGPM